MTVSDTKPSSIDLAKFVGATPGPWVVRDSGDFRFVTTDDHEVTIAELGLSPADDWAPSAVLELNATSALVASAPDLLARVRMLETALEACIDDIIASAVFEGTPRHEAERSLVIVRARQALGGQ